MAILEFSRLSDFTAFIRKGEQVRLFKYIRIAPPCSLHISTEIPSEPQSVGITRFIESDLPSPSECDRWWNDLFDNDVVDFWMHSDSSSRPRLLVAAKSGVWLPSNSVYTVLGKDEIVRIGMDVARKILGKKEFERMTTEVLLVGFSVRYLDP